MKTLAVQVMVEWVAGLNRGVENVADQPKITGLGFNLFAIGAVFILLPLATAFITTLSNANAEDFESITTEYSDEMYYDPSICNQAFGGSLPLGYNDVFSLTWLDKGSNSSSLYMDRDNIPSNEVERYESIYDPSAGVNYHKMGEYCGVSNYIQRDNDVFSIGNDNHAKLDDPHYLHGSNPNYAGYIGYSGDEYSFRVNTNQMKYLDQTKDISAIKMTFIDYHTGFSCDNPIFQDVSAIGDIKIKFNSAYDYLLYENFEFNQVNSYKVGFAPNNAGGFGSVNMNDFCHIGLEFEFDFSPIESIEISETFQKDYPSMALEITLRDFEFDNVTALNITAGSSNAPIPFTGDDNFAFNFEVAYVDTVRVNFWLNGGTLFMGGSLFLLAIANTPYWNPVINFFKKDGF